MMRPLNKSRDAQAELLFAAGLSAREVGRRLGFTPEGARLVGRRLGFSPYIRRRHYPLCLTCGVEISYKKKYCHRHWKKKCPERRCGCGRPKTRVSVHCMTCYTAERRAGAKRPYRNRAWHYDSCACGGRKHKSSARCSPCHLALVRRARRKLVKEEAEVGKEHSFNPPPSRGTASLP